MSAIIVCPSEEHWLIIQEFLDACGEGAIVIPPEVQKKMKQKIFSSVGGNCLDICLDGSYIDYAFEDSDICVDVAGFFDDDEPNWALQAVIDSVQEDQEDEE